MNDWQEFLDLLIDAELAAQTRWEHLFTDAMREAWLTYGPDLELTDQDIETLKQIAGRI